MRICSDGVKRPENQCLGTGGSHREPCQLVAFGNQPAIAHLIDGYEHPCGGLQGEVSHERQRQSNGSATSIFLTRMNNLMDPVTAWILGENRATDLITSRYVQQAKLDILRYP